MDRSNVSVGRSGRRTQEREPRGAQRGLKAALARGRAALDEWVATGLVVAGAVFAARRGVRVGQLGAAVRRGDLFSVGIRGRRYYVASLLDVKLEGVAEVCQALRPLSGTDMAFFWLRKHGALGAKTAVEVIREGRLDRVVQLALATSAQARADAQLRAGAAAPKTRTKTKSILDMAGMLQAPEGVHVSLEDMNPRR